MRKLVICVLLVLTAVLPSFAKKKDKNKNKDPWALEPNEVILVGKVTVVPKINKEFFIKSRRLTTQTAQEQDTYRLQGFSANMTGWESFSYLLSESNRTFYNGEYFCMKYRFPDNRRIEPKYFSYYFFDRKKLNIALPIPINFDVPEGAKALYIGNFTYTVEGDFFDITDMQVSYNLEEAQATLDRSMDRHYDLQKADWQYNRQLQLVDYKNITGTPSDSVVFYGGIAPGLEKGWATYVFSEASPIRLYPDQAMTETPFFVSMPVRPGSTYILRKWASVYGPAASFSEKDSILTVRVPKEPGLYYFGYYDGYTSIVKKSLKEFRRPSSASMKREALEAALECYKGTVWEDYIRAELDKR